MGKIAVVLCALNLGLFAWGHNGQASTELVVLVLCGIPFIVLASRVRSPRVAVWVGAGVCAAALGGLLALALLTRGRALAFQPVGAVALVVQLVVAALAALRVSGLVDREDRSVAGLTAFLAWAIWPYLLLGAVSSIAGWRIVGAAAAAGVSAAGWLALRAIVPMARTPEEATPTEATAASVRIAALATACALVAAAARAAAGPPAEWDATWYHLPMTASWLVTGRMDALCQTGWDPLECTSAYPGNVNVLFAPWLAAGLEGGIFLPQAAGLLLGALSVRRIAQRLGASSPAGILAACAWASTPLVLFQASDGLVDQVTAGFLLAGVAFSLRLEMKDRAGVLPAFFCGAASGLAIGSKLSAVAPALAVLAVFAIRCRSARAIVAGCAAAAALGGYWYARNAVQFGNPFFPVGLSLGSLSVLPGADPHLAASHESVFVSSAAGWLAYPWKFVAWDFQQGVGALWPVLLPAIPLAFLAGRRPSGAWTATFALAALWLLAWSFLGVRQPRFGIASAGLLAAGGCAAISSWGGESFAGRWLARVGAIAVALPAAALALVLARDAGERLANRYSPRGGLETPIETLVPRGGSVVLDASVGMFSTPMTYRLFGADLGRVCIPRSSLWRGGADAGFAELRQMGVAAVLVAESARFPGPPAYAQRPDAATPIWRRAWSEGGVTLYAVR